MVEDEYTDLVDDRKHTSASANNGISRGRKAKTLGVLEKLTNTTHIVTR